MKGQIIVRNSNGKKIWPLVKSYRETLPTSSELFKLLWRDVERVELGKDLLPEMFLQTLPGVAVVANLKQKNKTAFGLL